MSANKQIDEVFLQRAHEHGLLDDDQYRQARAEVPDRRAMQPGFDARDYVVERGWLNARQADELLDSGSTGTDTASYPMLHESTDEGEPPVHDIEIQPEDESFDEVPKLVEPLSPSYAVNDSGDSHLEMELPPPESASGDSLFDDNESRPSLTPMDTAGDDSGGPDAELTPEASLFEADALQPESDASFEDLDLEETGAEDLLDEMSLDAPELEAEPADAPPIEADEELYETLEFEEDEVSTVPMPGAETQPSGDLQPVSEDTRGFDDLQPARDTAAFEEPQPDSGATRGFDEVHEAMRTADGALDDDRPVPAFELTGSKGAVGDFAEFGEDDPVIEESDEITSNMSDSAVGEVMEQADDSYFGPPADLTITPQEMFEETLAPHGADDDSALFDSAKLAPRGDEAEVADDSGRDDNVTLPGETPLEATVLEDQIVFEEIDEDSNVKTDSGVFATGEAARPGPGEGGLGVESDITGDSGDRNIVGQELTVAELREQMGLGSGVKLGGPGDQPSALGRLKKSSKRKRYSVVREIARGGMGKVIEVEDNDLRRSVALKVLRKEMLERRDLVERFLEEAQITGQLEHPNIVPVHEIGVDGRGNLYFTMKLVEGEELASILSRLRQNEKGAEREFPIGRLVDIFIKVCEGIAFAHSHGVIHRDLKPSNIMVGRFGEVQIMDWGVAKIVGRDEEAAERLVRSDRGDDDSASTVAGSILGTPSYMSPEQARGEVNSLGPESDVFSLGVILYEMLCLHTPWTAKTSAQVLDQVKTFDPALPSERDRDTGVGRRIPPELEKLAMKCLNKQPGKRVASAHELVNDLRKWQEGGTLAAVEYSLGQLIAKWIGRHKVSVIMVLLFVVALTAGGIVAAQYFEGQNQKRSEEAVARAQATLDRADAAFAAADFEQAETLAVEAKEEATNARAINESNEEAQELIAQAMLVTARARGEMEARAEAESARREREARLKEFTAALGEARSALETARDDEQSGAALSDVKDAYETADRRFIEAQSIKVEGTDDERAEIAGSRNEIENWLKTYEQRQLAEKDLNTLRTLVSEAGTGLETARGLPDDRYRQAADGLVETISIADRAIAVSVSGPGADNLRDRAQSIKAGAALEFARRALASGHFDVADLMLNTAVSTGKLRAEIDKARESLNQRMAAQSRFTDLMAAARFAVNNKEWVLAQSQIQEALKEAETSEFATPRDRETLQRMLELAMLEELRARDANAASSQDLADVLARYNELMPRLKEPDYQARAQNDRADVRRRLGQALYDEGRQSEDLMVKGERLERALEYVTDRALIAEIQGELSAIKLQVAMQKVSDRLVLLPRGAFVVGSNREGDNNPQRIHGHSEFVFIDKYLVTNQEYKEFVDAGGYSDLQLWDDEAHSMLDSFTDTTGVPAPAGWAEGGFDPSLAKYPVTGVSWYEARAYARWAGKRLPSPDEWELAAGAPEAGEAGGVGEYPSGTREDLPEGGVREPREVGTTEWDASRHGVRDMGNNVAEWTGRELYGRAVIKGAEPGLRAELFYRYARRAKNSFARPGDRSLGRGFRCAVDLTMDMKDGADDED